MLRRCKVTCDLGIYLKDRDWSTEFIRELLTANKPSLRLYIHGHFSACLCLSILGKDISKYSID